MERYLRSSTKIVQKAIECIIAKERISPEQGIALYEEAELPLLSLAATLIRLRLNNSHAYYNRNHHIEPTNICHFRCSFCSFRRDEQNEGAWLLSLEEIAEKTREIASLGSTEIHITGGVLPSWRLDDLTEIIRTVRREHPHVHIKAFSAIELMAIFKWSNVTLYEGLQQLKEAGLGSIPGGGAEIFDESIRRQICPEKGNAHEWLALHRAAHELGLPSNATMLYGHIEKYHHRIDHLERLRELQDETGGFNCFIPLKFRARGNSLGERLGEVSQLEVLRNFAVSRLYLDNIRHMKAYWPMLGKENIPLSLAYGVDDLDGTIGDSTKIYSMAGSEEQRPEASVEELRSIIRRSAGYAPIERDSYYKAIHLPQGGSDDEK